MARVGHWVERQKKDAVASVRASNLHDWTSPGQHRLMHVHRLVGFLTVVSSALSGVRLAVLQSRHTANRATIRTRIY